MRHAVLPVAAGLALAAAALAQTAPSDKPAPPPDVAAQGDKAATPAAPKEITQIRWRLRGWAGDAWDNDLNLDMPVTALPEGGWRIVNNAKETAVGVAILTNVRLTDGPVELAVRMPKECAVAFGGITLTGKNIHWEGWKKGTDDWVTVVVGYDKGRPTAAAAESPLFILRTGRRVEECDRPFLWMPTGARIDIRSCRQLPDTEPIIPVDWRLTPPLPAAAPAVVDWRACALADGKWARESPKGVSVARQEDGSWFLINNSDAPAAILLLNLDARRGDVAMEVRTSAQGVIVGLISASRSNMYAGVPVFERSQWVPVRIGIAFGKPAARVYERRETCDKFGALPDGTFTVTDIHQPFVYVPRASVVSVRRIGQVPQGK